MKKSVELTKSKMFKKLKIFKHMHKKKKFDTNISKCNDFKSITLRKGVLNSSKN